MQISSSHPWLLAPWVIEQTTNAGLLMLGPRWGAFELDEALDPGSLAADQCIELAEAGILFDPDREVTPSTPSIGEPPIHPFSAIEIVTGNPTTAQRLAAALEAVGDDSLPQLCPRSRGIITVLAPMYEDLEALTEQVAAVIDNGPVLYLGEASEGLHCGPWFRDLSDVERYIEVTRDTAWAQLLDARGLPPRWPTSTAWLLTHRPDDLVAAIAYMLDAKRHGAHDCVLVDGCRPVDLWARLHGEPTTLSDFIEYQGWSKGALRQLDVERVDAFDVFVAHASSPCANEPHLSDNFGKGYTADQAKRVALGETVERLAAWMANDLPEFAAEHAPPRSFSLADFHPNGPAWNEFLKRPVRVPMRVAIDASSGESVGVPSFLVPFPFTDTRDPLLYRLDGHTSGLAAYPTRSGAVLRAALELLERHDLYPRFVHHVGGQRIDPYDLGRHYHGTPLGRTLAALAEDESVELHVVHYPSEFGVPIAHAFAHDTAHGFVTRGSGSGCDFGAAAQRAILECVLGRREALQLEHDVEHTDAHRSRFNDWATAEVVEHIVTYLEAQPMGPMPLLRFDGEATLLQHVLRTMAQRQVPLLIADLPCPIQGWSAVRALAPGLTTHQIASDSAGGRRLLDPAFAYGIPT